jgi:hypothetical protein
MYPTALNRFGTRGGTPKTGGSGSDEGETALDKYTKDLHAKASEGKENQAISDAANANEEKLAKELGDAADADIEAHAKRFGWF